HFFLPSEGRRRQGGKHISNASSVSLIEGWHRCVVQNENANQPHRLLAPSQRQAWLGVTRCTKIVEPSVPVVDDRQESTAGSPAARRSVSELRIGQGSDRGRHCGIICSRTPAFLRLCGEVQAKNVLTRAAALFPHLLEFGNDSVSLPIRLAFDVQPLPPRNGY